MATLKPTYATGQTLTVTIASMTNATANSSAVVDNTTDLNDDVIVTGKITANASGVSATGYVDVCVHASADAGTSFAGTTATGASTGITKRNAGFKLAARVLLNSNGMVNEFSFSVASLYGGSVPGKFLLSIANNSGATLDATAGNHNAKYQGVQYQSA